MEWSDDEGYGVGTPHAETLSHQGTSNTPQQPVVRPPAASNWGRFPQQQFSPATPHQSTTSRFGQQQFGPGCNQPRPHLMVNPPRGYPTNNNNSNSGQFSSSVFAQTNTRPPFLGGVPNQRQFCHNAHIPSNGPRFVARPQNAQRPQFVGGAAVGPRQQGGGGRGGVRAANFLGPNGAFTATFNGTPRPGFRPAAGRGSTGGASWRPGSQPTITRPRFDSNRQPPPPAHHQIPNQPPNPTQVGTPLNNASTLPPNQTSANPAQGQISGPLGNAQSKKRPPVSTPQPASSSTLDGAQPVGEAKGGGAAPRRIFHAPNGKEVTEKVWLILKSEKNKKKKLKKKVKRRLEKLKRKFKMDEAQKAKTAVERASALEDQPEAVMDVREGDEVPVDAQASGQYSNPEFSTYSQFGDPDPYVLSDRFEHLTGTVARGVN